MIGLGLDIPAVAARGKPVSGGAVDSSAMEDGDGDTMIDGDGNDMSYE